MPYIKIKRRKVFLPHINSICKVIKRNSSGMFSLGELNYIITKLLILSSPVTYEDHNALLGMLDACSKEFFRRKVSVYEDKKIEENGDVY